MKITRRQMLAAGALAGSRLLCGPLFAAGSSEATIDRRTVVRRHNPLIQKFDPFSALTVGNGNFAFTADVTGLQTFSQDCQKDFPLCTGAHWAWHTTPMPPGMKAEDYRYKEYNSHGRMVGYATDRKGQEALYDWLRQNPHRMHLGRIGLILKKSDGSSATVGDVEAISQTLDLWTGILDSRFTFARQTVRVQTACHPDLDALAIRIDSPMLNSPNLGVQIAFPYPSPEMDMADWNSAAKHATTLDVKGTRADFSRKIDGDSYFASAEWSNGTLRQTDPHEFSLGDVRAETVDMFIVFSPAGLPAKLPSVDETLHASQTHWQSFWTTGAAIDLGDSVDPRAPELERRIVLSQYNTAINCAGPITPQESGLLFNTWFGKSHLEMHWWHAAHFAAWNRFELLERSLGFYQRIIPVGQATAKRQGYDGIRWPKMVGPEGRDSPSPIAPLLIWQQPHPIYYAEISYQRNPTKEMLDRWSEIVFGSADFMASFAALENDRYALGPPLRSVPEHTDTMATHNPTFELAYWRFGLRTALEWRRRLGLKPEPKWQDVLDRLAPLPQQDGLYLMMEGLTDTYTKWNWEHPSLLGAYGMQPGDGVNPETMRRSLEKILDIWQWERGWGWDYPMAAMTAARLKEPDLAVRALMIDAPNNRYLPNGHVYQRHDLPAYLPASGGLLSAVAMMATNNAFPRDSKWSVKTEGFATLL
jgi:protein-glucosylgalactosylhydroxylysine glucosidase